MAAVSADGRATAAADPTAGVATPLGRQQIIDAAFMRGLQATDQEELHGHDLCSALAALAAALADTPHASPRATRAADPRVVRAFLTTRGDDARGAATPEEFTALWSGLGARSDPLLDWPHHARATKHARACPRAPPHPRPRLLVTKPPRFTNATVVL